jgi:5'-nucleotidase
VGHGITLEAPLRARPVKGQGPRWLAVSGTPADCAYFAVHHALSSPPDLVVSGINRGNNLGEDVLYSGTVAAAMEGCLMGLPALAVSLQVGGDMRAAASLARAVAAMVLADGLPPRTFLNLNVPSKLSSPWQLQVAPLGHRRYQRQVVPGSDPRGRPYYWIGGPEIIDTPTPGTDTAVNAGGHPCITPLQLDITAHDYLDALRRRCEALPRDVAGGGRA